jgi:hypothetical protein
MDQQQLSIMANTFQSVFDASTLDARGRDLKFCQRHRLITPFRFGLSVVASMASQRVPNIATIQGQLRTVHLRAHLAQRNVLTPEQRRHYDALRGYEAPSHHRAHPHRGH